MIFVKAFILGGILSFLAQLLFMKTKLNPIQVLTIAFCCGPVLTAFGIMDHLTLWGESGMFLMIIDSGEGVYKATKAAMDGDFLPAIKYLSLIVSAFGISALGGISYNKRNSEHLTNMNVKS